MADATISGDDVVFYVRINGRRYLATITHECLEDVFGCDAYGQLRTFHANESEIVDAAESRIRDGDDNPILSGSDF